MGNESGNELRKELLMPSILFVCLGNICRSPAAEGVLRHMSQKEPLKDQLLIESCGLGDWHVGQLPDERMRYASKNRGFHLSSRAQQFIPAFFDRFDLILAADHQVLDELLKHAPVAEHKRKIHLITHFSCCYPDEEIPDPYYQGDSGFEQVLDMIEDSCRGILEFLRESRELG